MAITDFILAAALIFLYIGLGCGQALSTPPGDADNTAMSATLKNILMGLGVACATLGNAGAEIEEHWVYGVTKESGWYDFDKVFDGNDDLLCWAAASSNVIAWWENYNPGLTSQTSAPTGEDIWTTYKQSYKNTGGYAEDSFYWYFYEWEEEYRPTWMNQGLTDYGHQSGAYFSTVFDNKLPEIVFSSPNAYDDITEFSSNFCAILDAGYGVTIAVEGPGVSHALTLWGVEYDTEQELITRLWLTDSDDINYEAERGDLFSVSIDYREDDDYWVPLMYLVSDDVRSDGMRWYDGKEFFRDFTVMALYPLPGSVPEPATGTLSLLALAGLMARRRRK